MLKKLLKKDLQATARMFLPLILGFVVMSALAKMMFEVGFLSPMMNNYSFVSDTNEFVVFFSIVIMTLYVIYIVAFFIMTYVFIVSDFYKTMVGEQGYLTHTLPVKTSTLINSKLIIAIFWQVVTGLLVILSLVMFAVGHMSEIPWQEFLTEFDSILGISMKEYLVFMSISLIIETFSSPLMFFASIAIGHLFGKHKVMGSILSYLGIYTVLQIICTVAMFAFGYSLTLSMRMTESAAAFSAYGSFLRSYLWFGVIFSLVTSVIFYVITNFVMSKKLNLE